MSYESRCEDLVRAMRLTNHEESTTHPAHSESFNVRVRDRHGKQVLLAWVKEHPSPPRWPMQRHDEGDDTTVLVLSRPLCKNCNQRWGEHATRGGQCLFQSTQYEEPPL